MVDLGHFSALLNELGVVRREECRLPYCLIAQRCRNVQQAVWQIARLPLTGIGGEW